MNIVLINPPYKIPVIREGRCQNESSMRGHSIPQMSLSYMAAVLENAGHNCFILDYMIDDYSGWILKPELVFVNTSTPTILSDIECCASIKEHWGAKVAVFGCHVSILPEEILSTHTVDYVIIGEPENAALKIATAIKEGKRIVSIVKCAYESNLDNFGFPARHLTYHDKYIHPIYKKPYTIINISRGCNSRCIFCTASQYYGKKVRKRSVNSVLDEIGECINKYGIVYFWFYSEDATYDREYLKGICFGIIERNYKIKWWCNSRADNIDMAIARYMKESGCVLVSIGAESGSAECLKAMKKGIVNDDTTKAIKQLKHQGVDTVLYFIFGFPWDTQESIKTTIKFAIKNNPDYCEFYAVTPFPGTELYEMSKTNLITHDWSNYFCGGTKQIISVPGILPYDIPYFIKKAYREFYFRPRYILNILRKNNPFKLVLFGIRRLKSYV